MIGGEEEARTGMKVEHGERMGRNSCLLSKGEGKRKKKRNTKQETPFPFSHEEMETCVVTRVGAFIPVFL